MSSKFSCNFFLFFFIVLSGCAGLQTGQDTHLIWQYGNFCGKNRPLVDEKLSKSERIEYLKRIETVDDVDLACKYHDICYELSIDDQVCDSALFYNLDAIVKSYDNNAIVTSLALMIRYNKQSGIDVPEPYVEACQFLIHEIANYAMHAYAIHERDGEIKKYLLTLVSLTNAGTGEPVKFVMAPLVKEIRESNKNFNCNGKKSIKFMGPDNYSEFYNMKNCHFKGDFEQAFKKCGAQDGIKNTVQRKINILMDKKK